MIVVLVDHVEPHAGVEAGTFVVIDVGELLGDLMSRPIDDDRPAHGLSGVPAPDGGSSARVHDADHMPTVMNTKTSMLTTVRKRW